MQHLIVHPGAEEQIKHPSLNIVIAPPRQGKTTFIRKMVLNGIRNKIYHFGYVFSGSADHNDDYAFMPQRYVSNGIGAINAVNNIILPYQIQHKRPIFIVLDDLLGIADFGSAAWLSFFARYRHFNCSVFLVTQYINKIPVAIRVCATNAIIFNVSGENSYKSIHNNFLQSLTRYEADKIIKTATNCKSFNYLLIVNGDGGYFKGNVQKLPPFKIVF